MTQNQPPIWKWFALPPDKRPPLAWVKMTGGGWALMPAGLVEQFKAEQAQADRLAALACYALTWGALLVILALVLFVLLGGVP